MFRLGNIPRVVLAMTLLAASTAVTAGDALRVMTFNTGMGASRFLMPQLLPAKDAVERMAPLITETVGDAPAVVCLQEVDEGRTRSGSGTLSDLVGALNAAGQPGWQGHYYPLTEFNSDGTTGIAVLSRLNQEISTARWQTFDGGENRGALALRLQMGNHPVWVVNTHMGFTDPAGQVSALIDGMQRQSADATVILCGDMNIPDPAVTRYPLVKSAFQSTLGPLLQHGFVSATADAEPTYPAWARLLGVKLDYLFVRPKDGLTIGETRVVDPQHEGRYISDHRGLFLDLVDPATAGGVGYAE